MSALREEGTIDSVFNGTEDHGILTVYLGIDFGSSHQSFGGLALDELSRESFVAALCRVFAVAQIDDLKGRRCVALRCFEGWGSAIEGIESPSGGRLVIYDWRLKHWGPAKVKDPLETALASSRSTIASLERRLEDERRCLATIAAKYHPIEARR